ncbi:MAG: hypothetical protein J3K34DRAFT_432104 [Monoraphidium minutum]|nr:MAG: hypothetical protein J3K34DRAFT_432104 [Monoraphidium minutum]
MVMGNVSRPVVLLLSLLQLGAAITIIGITGIQLANINLKDWDSVVNQKVCLLAEDNNTSICLYAYALGAVSLVFTLTIGLMQICTCNWCGCGAVMDSVFAVLACGWWLVGAFVISAHATAATKAGVRQRQWREAVAWITWITAGLFGALFLVHMVRVASKYCCCRRRRRGAAEDADKAMLGAARPRSAAVELGKEVRGRSYMGGGQPPLQQQFMGDARNI